MAHEPGPDRLWGESWYFDFTSADGSAGGFVRVGDYPHLGRRWWWAYVIASGRAAGASLDLPLSGDREAPWRTADPSLSVEIEPGTDGWHIRVEGDGFGMALTWRPEAPEYVYRRGSRLEQPGWAAGEVCLGAERFRLDGPGQRDHSWGVRDWWRFGWTWCAGRLADGTRFQATVLDARGRIAPDGYLLPPGRSLKPVRDVTIDGDVLRMDGTEFAFADLGHVTLELPSPTGGRSRLRRAISRVRAGGMPDGIGWREQNRPDRLRV
jgi:hypothetical protein